MKNNHPDHEMNQLIQKLIDEHGVKEMRTLKDLEDYIGEGDEAQNGLSRRTFKISF